MTEEDEAFNELEKTLGWRKRQMIQANLDRDHTNIRNDTLEEIAREFEKMKVFEADTMASIAVHIRNMKNEWFR